MIIENIKSRGTFFTFEEGDSAFPQETSVYLINTEHIIFICDTHIGPKSMDVVKKYINSNGLESKDIIIFNSHSDWDHIWGNCAFEDATVIAHESCRMRMNEIAQYDLERYKGIYNDGTIRLKLPNLTFDRRLRYEDLGIEFIYAPGHTVDSSICFDTKDSVIFAGDLIEHPHPYLDYDDLEAYVKTLEYIKSLKAEIILSGHSGRVDEKLIDENIAYIKKAMLKHRL